MKSIKIKIALVIMILFGVYSNAQSESLNKEINTYTKRIDSIVVSEKKKMNVEMDFWKLKLENQEISKEEYTNAKNRIAQKYEDEINFKINTQKKYLDSITTVQVKESIFMKTSECSSPNKAKVSLNVGNNSKENFSKGKIIISYSIGNLAKSSGFDLFNKNSEMKIGNTHSVEVYYRRTIQLGNQGSPFFAHYGLAYRTDTYMPKNNKVFAEENNQLVLKDFTEGNLKRSKLRNVYFLIPLEFSWVVNPSYTNTSNGKKFKKDSRQFRIGVGAYAGLNSRSIIKVKYYNADDKFKKYKNVIENGVNPYVVGGKFSVSYGMFTLFIKKDFTPAFDDKAQLPFKNNLQFGVVISDIVF